MRDAFFRIVVYGSLFAASIFVIRPLVIDRYEPSDIDRNGVVDLRDLSILSKDFKSTAQRSDLNGDGIVDLKDFGIFLIELEQ